MSKKVAKRKSRKKAPKRVKQDYCESCDICDAPEHNQPVALYLCKNCQKTVCAACRDKKGRCSFCADYDFGPNVQVLMEGGLGGDVRSAPYSIGGNLKDMPKPLKHWYDDPKHVMVVKVSVKKFYGVGVHYWTTIMEDANPVWDGERWTKCWDDNTYPFREEKQCKSQETATAFVKAALKKRYKKKPVRLSFDQGRLRRWFYKEGD